MSGYPTRHFKDVCGLQKGKKPVLQAESQSGSQPYLTARYMRGTESPQWVAGVDENAIKVQSHELIIICDGSNSGETFYGVEGILSSTMAKVSHGAEIDTTFLRYFLISQLAKYSETKTGAAIPHLDLKALKEERIPVPPLSEQQRIVGILDQAFEGLTKVMANAERNRANAKELFESELEEVFSLQDASWSEATLSEVCLKFGRGKSRHRPRNDPSLYGGDYPFIQTGDVRNSGDWITAYSQTYNEKGLAQSLLWPRGTLCITIAANIAEIGILDFDACFPDSIIGCVVNEDKTSNEYLCYILRYYQAHLKAQGKGSAQDNINLATFENQKFPFPSLPVQEEIVEKLNSIWSSIEAYELNRQAAITGIADLRRSILHLAFSGNL